MYKRLKDNQIQTPIKGLAGLKFSYQRKKREMLSNTVCQFVTLISCVGTILSAYIAMKTFKMGTLGFLNKMFAFYFVFDAFQGCLQNYAMLPLFYER